MDVSQVANAALAMRTFIGGNEIDTFPSTVSGPVSVLNVRMTNPAGGSQRGAAFC